MLTKRKYVLFPQNSSYLDFLTRFEAIELIDHKCEINRVMRNNKMPLTRNIEAAYSLTNGTRDLLEIPETACQSEEAFIKFCHSKLFECGEYVHDKRYDVKETKGCFLCKMANYGDYPDAYQFNLNVENEGHLIVYESENFVVKVELGCMSPGLMMICTKQHLLSAAQIPKEMMNEYEQIMRDVEFLLKAVFGKELPVIFFEHGTSPEGISTHESAISHMHTHVFIGVSFTKKYIEMVKLRPAKLESLAKNKYLSYQEGAKGQFMAVSNPDVYVQRQYPRQVICELLGFTDSELYNWRNEKFVGNMQITFRKLYDYLSENAEQLSPRIVAATDNFVKGYRDRYMCDRTED